nr:AAA family ATPase [uncultured Janthinobacterium sp.]
MNIVIVSKNEAQLKRLTRLLRERSSSDRVALLASIPDIFDNGATPDVLLLEQEQTGEAELERLELLGGRHPNLAIIVQCPQQSPQFLLRSMRAGVREVLQPDDDAALCAALRRIEEKLQKQVMRKGQVLAFVSCKGGSGATFIAANLGYALAAGEQRKVALFDLNLQFGDAALFVSDHKPAATLSQLSQQIVRLDASLLAASMIQITPAYSVLAAADDPAHAADVEADHIDRLLTLARSQYDYILLDVGRGLDPVSVRALDRADLIFPVLQATLPYVRDGKRLLDVFRGLGYREDKIRLILNRYASGDNIRVADLEAAYGKHVYKSIPNHYEAVAASVSQGVPILKLTPHNAVSRALQELAASLAGETPPAAQSWVSRLLARA